MRIYQQPWFSKIIHPSRYLGEEINSINKDPSNVEVYIALAFPDVYEIGMSHLGLKILYHILNSQDWLSAERVFAPWVDLESELRNRNIPLTSLESGRALSEFNIVGFSLQHELCYTNILSMLDLSDIPFLSEQRGSMDPLIIAGGPACFNPEPAATLFDAMVIGDGEEVALSICRTVREWKLDGRRSRFELLKELSKFRGVYIPSFFKVHYDRKGIIRCLEPLIDGYTGVEKAIVPDLNCYPFPSKQIVPFAELVHDRFTIEIARGCSGGCRFCQAGMIYRPVRERDPLEILRAAEAGLDETGFEDLSLLSLSSGDYTCIVPLLKELVRRFADRNVAISFSSLRIDGVISLLLEEIKKVRKTSFTIAPEAGSQRLRDIINKGLTDDQILSTAREIYEGGWNLIKLYFMIGLPYEVESDLMSIVELSKKISRLAPKRRKGHVLNVSVASFVPKAHTPFAWIPQLELEESKRRIDLIRKRLQGHKIGVKWNKPEASWLEGIFSRGDRRLTKVLVEAWQQGARFDSWSEHLNLDVWKKALRKYRLDPDFYLARERDHDEILPWEHLHSGVSKGFLYREWKKAMEGERTPYSRENCLGCGVCNDPNISPVLFDSWHHFKEKVMSQSKESKDRIKRYRLNFTKLEKARYLSHLELMRLFIRAFRRAGMDLVYSGGYHPMPRVSFALALPVGIESLAEMVDIQVKNSQNTCQTIERLNRELPPGIKVLFMKEISTKAPPPRTKESYFHIKVNGSFSAASLDRFLRVDTYPVVRRHRNSDRTVDIRSQVRELNLLSKDEIQLVIRHGRGPGAKPAEIMREIFALPDSQMEEMRILKTKCVLACG
ncbi:MAG: TIGR03960 family B12-binding radical SAM protein [Deltaproteobacteria bacterium]|nr:MAG: TIGR03960 family B12-binding radical SAM protein [Deltaproteobacteria bacterium]